MYTDKINPDHPEGRLLISEKCFLLKDPSLPASVTPLPDKAQTMFNHLEDKGFETKSKARMRRAYNAICQAKAWRNISRYNQVLRMLPKEQKFLSCNTRELINTSRAVGTAHGAAVLRLHHVRGERQAVLRR